MIAFNQNCDGYILSDCGIELFSTFYLNYFFELLNFFGTRTAVSFIAVVWTILVIVTNEVSKHAR